MSQKIRSFHRLPLLAVAAATLALAGCASGPREISSQVQTYASMQAVQLPNTYRLELLPSQSQQASFSQIEFAAQQALARVGLNRDSQPEQASLVVQVGANASQGHTYHPAYDYPRPMFGWGMGFGHPWGMGMGMRWDLPPMVYNRAVKLVIRDRQSQQIVYETSAVYDEVWMDDSLIWGVLFDAALTGFPNPPQGPRQVRSLIAPAAPAAEGAAAMLSTNPPR